MKEHPFRTYLKQSRRRMNIYGMRILECSVTPTLLESGCVVEEARTKTLAYI